jgi:hypothetical protein
MPSDTFVQPFLRATLSRNLFICRNFFERRDDGPTR